jgi:hypothetical protein
VSGDRGDLHRSLGFGRRRVTRFGTNLQKTRRAAGDDRRLDLTDVFAFTTPHDPDTTVLIIDSNPTSAPPPIPAPVTGPEFYPGAVYRINIVARKRKSLSDRHVRLSCSRRGSPRQRCRSARDFEPAHRSAPFPPFGRGRRLGRIVASLV